MNDNDVLQKIRDSVSEVHTDMPVDTILSRGRSRRRRRLSALAGAGAAAGVALTLGLTGMMSSGNTPPAATSHGARLTAFTVVSGPDGTSTLTLRKGKQYRLDPGALRQALAQHGIPALVTVGSMCDSAQAPAGLDQVLSTRRLADGTVVTTFNPAAMPAGSKLSIGYFQTGTTFTLIEDGAALTCTGNPGSSHTIVRGR
jgi:hypothetical protein